jgi:hypothetical protein
MVFVLFGFFAPVISFCFEFLHLAPVKFRFGSSSNGRRFNSVRIPHLFGVFKHHKRKAKP